VTPQKRRPRGDGGLYQRADGAWVGVVELPLVNGKRQRRCVASKDRNEAIRKLKKLRADVDSGRIAVTGNTTVEKWLNRWLTEIHADKIRPTTQRDYRTAIDLHINPTLGKKRLDKLTTAHIHQMHAALGKRRAAEKAHIILKKALKDAIREGMITHNVAEMVDPPKYKKARRTSLSVEVAANIIRTAERHCDESQAARWAAAFLTGARQSELLGLRWSYVDLDNGYMDISWQLQQLSQVHGCGEKDEGGKYPCARARPGWCPERKWNLPPDFEHEICHRSLVWTRPKTEAGGREVPIIAPLLTALRQLHKRQGNNPHNLVWHLADGRPIGPRDDYRTWHQLIVRAGVIKDDETLTMHIARHTTATLLRAAGIDEQTRMEILGHAQADSQRVYAHADRQRHQLAMGTLGELLGPTASPTPN
jgi:integrase